MTFDTSYDRYKNYMLYDTFEGQVGVIFVEIFRWSDDLFMVRMMILTENSQDYGPDHLQLTLLNWDTESVLALNKKNWKSIENYSIFYLVPKHFLSIELFVEQRPWKFGRSDNSIWIGYHLREEHIMLPLFLLH